MSFFNFPSSIDQVNASRWETFEPYYDELLERVVTPDTLQSWLTDWSQLDSLAQESGTMIYIQKSLDTSDEEKERAFIDFVSNVQPLVSRADQKLKERLLAMELSPNGPANMNIMLRNMRNQADLFRDKNVPIQTELAKLGNEYNKITGGMIADWDGEKKNLSQLNVFLEVKDRRVRERAWKAMLKLWLAQRVTLNQLYSDMLELRQRLAENAGIESFREYAFRDYDRFDYTIDDCINFHRAIEQAVVPAAGRIYAKKRRRLGVSQLRPWDVDVDTTGANSLQPYAGQDELVQGGLNIIQEVDSVLALYFAIMAEENLLDLDTRGGKALGGYCATLPLRKRPFIFMNGAGTHDDVQTLLHELGHAFHVFETASLPFIWQQNPPMEFAEVASMGMELLSAPYLSQNYGGFYSQRDAARARIEHLEGILLFLPYMAIVDAFQHWVYTNPALAGNSANCDDKWGELWARFIP
jgi:oligoendopeptidase F